ncbi:MAG: M48 family metallopeptidase [Arenicella sp.]
MLDIDDPRLFVSHYGETSFEYKVVYKPQSLDHKIRIHVYPDGEISVDAPERASVIEIKQAVQKRARWICSRLNEFEKQKENVFLRSYISGETFYYLGRRYQLKLDSQQYGSLVKLKSGRFLIPARGKEPDQIKTMMNGWYSQKAKQVFQRRLELAVSRLGWVSSVPDWKLLKMKKQWGSCSPSGVLSLNPELVKAPIEAIDYVLLHELCHIKHHNHGKRFYELLDHHMKDWQLVKRRLDGMASLMLNQ